MTWHTIDTAPEDVVVETKIDDAYGCRNVQKLVRKKRLWFFPDMSMYVYYEPTHWAHTPRSNQPMANDSILTRAEVEQERKSLVELDSKFGGDMKVDCFVVKQSELLNGYTQAVELLERCVHPADIDALKQAKRGAAEWLARYHAASSLPQPEPSPPQK